MIDILFFAFCFITIALLIRGFISFMRIGGGVPEVAVSVTGYGLASRAARKALRNPQSSKKCKTARGSALGRP